MDQYRRLKRSIAPIFDQLIVPRLQQLDQVLAPGCTSLTWVSPNIDEFCDTVTKALDTFELVLTRVSDLIDYRIDSVLIDMTNISLCYLEDEEPITADEFYGKTEELCKRSGELLQTKSSNIEDATEELIKLIYPEYNSVPEMHIEREPEEIKSMSAKQLDRPILKPQLTPAQLAAKRKREARIQMHEVAQELFIHFNHRNLDAIIKLIRTTLERIRRRILASVSANIYGENSNDKKRESPVFKGWGMLAIPNIVMQPSTEEIQIILNKSVQSILSVSNQVLQWTKGKRIVLKRELSKREASKEVQEGSEDNNAEVERPGTPSSSQQMQKTYFRSVSENKDIIKLVSLLSTCISSTKRDIAGTVERFKEYHFIWQKDREQDLKEFLSQDPRASEFETKIRSFQNVINEINSYPEYLAVGAIAIMTEKLKMGLAAEIKTWKLFYGNACNQKYKREINEILAFIDEITKRLQHEIKDLDDIRLTMNALKELRENEIRIDMEIAPIEESYAMLQKHEIEVSKEEMERCDTLRYSWEKLKQMASHKSGVLLEIQPLYKDELKKNVKDFVKNCENYYNDYRRVSSIFNNYTTLILN